MKIKTVVNQKETITAGLTTVGKSGIVRVAQMYKLLGNAGNQSRGAALAELFPWPVIQGFILVLVIIYSRL